MNILNKLFGGKTEITKVDITDDMINDTLHNLKSNGGIYYPIISSGYVDSKTLQPTDIIETINMTGKNGKVIENVIITTKTKETP